MTSSFCFLLISIVFNISFCIVLVLYLNSHSFRLKQQILFLYTFKFSQSTLSISTEILNTIYMIINKFIFRVPYFIISQAIISFLVVLINSRVIKLNKLAIIHQQSSYKFCYIFLAYQILNFICCPSILFQICFVCSQSKAKVAFIYLTTKFNILLAFMSYTKYFRISLNFSPKFANKLYIYF